MHVAVDARELTGRPTGVGRYLSRILAEWTRLPAALEHRYTMYAPRAVLLPPGLPAASQVLPGSGGTRWEQATLAATLRRDRPDVLFAPGYTAPLLAPCPVVLAVHDVSFAAHPEWYRWREGLRRRLLTRAAARRAARVVTLSEFSRAEIARYLGVPAQRVRVVPLGLGLSERQAGGRSHAREPLVLYVGSIFNRRHLPDLIAAFGLVHRRRPDARLVIVGENRTWPHQDLAAEIARLGLRSEIRLADYVTDEELQGLYGRASVFLFLSEYEGFGLTPLEALAAGVPPVVLDTPVAREVYGPAATYVASAAPAGVAEAILRLLEDEAARQRLLAQAAPLIARYAWGPAAAATLAAIEEVARA